MERYSLAFPMNFVRLDFDYDRTVTNAPALIQKLIIERRVSVPFNKERFYCAAPLRTTDHAALLTEIESLLR